MVSLREAQRRLKKVTEAKLQKKVEEFVINDQTIIEAKQDELTRGLTPDGTIIGTYSWAEYEAFKKQINPLADGNVDLKLTGMFQSRLFVRSKGNSKFDFDSRDSKAPMLFEKYGNDVKGLNRDTFNDLQKIEYAPKLVKYIKQITRL
jgi:hypothetical protein